MFKTVWNPLRLRKGANMKKWLSLAVVVWSLGRILLADTTVVDGYVWMYDSFSKSCEIWGCSPKPTGTLTIPSQLNGYGVTAIQNEFIRGLQWLDERDDRRRRDEHR